MDVLDLLNCRRRDDGGAVDLEVVVDQRGQCIRYDSQQAIIL
jgi:hypothetical protein